MADQDPIPDRQDRNLEESGDTNSADIVGRTGEQMPEQTHDGIDADQRDRGDRPDDKKPRRVSD